MVFVCTNLAVGGGGIFAGGFMSIHARETPLEKFTEQASKYLGGFDQIVETYRLWAREWLEAGALDTILNGVSSWHRKQIRQVFASRKPTSEFVPELQDAGTSVLQTPDSNAARATAQKQILKQKLLATLKASSPACLILAAVISFSKGPVSDLGRFCQNPRAVLD